ncbi:MAG: hypothetical protein H6767_02605 [Candidatus Peribacteria bacterium]|nr:MAG: hypothetical protein H6767_02605 [Candidatus Peribacteria bacterium]
METREDSPIVGHRDTGHTDCPGDELYKQIALLRQELIPITAGLAPVPYTAVSTTKVTSNSKIEGALEKLPQYTLLKLLVQVEEQIDATTDMSKKTRLLLLKNIIQKIYEEKFGFTEGDDKRTSSDDTEYIKIKLSYPEDDHISITSGNKTYDIQVAGDGLEVQ